MHNTWNSLDCAGELWLRCKSSWGWSLSGESARRKRGEPPLPDVEAECWRVTPDVIELLSAPSPVAPPLTPNAEEEEEEKVMEEERESEL